MKRLKYLVVATTHSGSLCTREGTHAQAIDWAADYLLTRVFGNREPYYADVKIFLRHVVRGRPGEVQYIDVPSSLRRAKESFETQYANGTRVYLSR